VEYLAARLAAIPGVVAVTLGGSRATNTAVEGSDWDFGLYYRGRLDPADVAALGWPGQVFAPGEWGRIVNGGAWLTIDGTKVDLIYRDLGDVEHWTAAAEDGKFEIQREVGYVAGIPTYVLAGELALGRVLAGTLPRPGFPPKLRQTAPVAWYRLAAGALHFAGVHAGRQDRVACLPTWARRCWPRPRAAWPPPASGCSTKSGLPNGPGCTPSRTGSRIPNGT
jgi:hypothetical protein